MLKQCQHRKATSLWCGILDILDVPYYREWLTPSKRKAFSLLSGPACEGGGWLLENERPTKGWRGVECVCKLGVNLSDWTVELFVLQPVCIWRKWNEWESFMRELASCQCFLESSLKAFTVHTPLCCQSIMVANPSGTADMPGEAPQGNKKTQ